MSESSINTPKIEEINLKAVERSGCALNTIAVLTPGPIKQKPPQLNNSEGLVSFI